jgi:large subunit ribosomal protein L10
MTREEKAEIIEDLSKKFAEHNYFYITDASGLSVEQINKFRKLCFNKGIDYRVVKNTLIEKALDKLDTDFSQFTEKALKGFSGIMFADTGNLPGKVLKEFRGQGVERPVLKGASIDTAFYFGDESLDTLAKLKSKEEVIGDIIGLLQSPAQNVISALQSGKNKLAGIVKTLSERPE